VLPELGDASDHCESNHETTMDDYMFNRRIPVNLDKNHCYLEGATPKILIYGLEVRYKQLQILDGTKL